MIQLKSRFPSCLPPFFSRRTRGLGCFVFLVICCFEERGKGARRNPLFLSPFGFNFEEKARQSILACFLLQMPRAPRKCQKVSSGTSTRRSAQPVGTMRSDSGGGLRCTVVLIAILLASLS